MEHTTYPQMQQNPSYPIDPNAQNPYNYQNYYYHPQSINPNPTVLDHPHNYYQQYQDPTQFQQPVIDPNNPHPQYAYNHAAQYSLSHDYTYQQAYYQNQYAVDTNTLGVNMGTYGTNQPQDRRKWKKPPKKTMVVQSAWCDICHIKCDTNDVLVLHKQGKKHEKNLKKLRNAAAAAKFHSASAPTPVPVPTLVVIDRSTTAPISASASGLLVARAASDTPLIGPQENPNKATKASKKKKRSKTSEPLENLETKKKKVVEGGAAAEAVRTCSVCNVVCNSDTVYSYHIAGQKHAAMMKKHAAMMKAHAPLTTVVDAL